jgi:regulator of protease activity HflC (stomatin/prohibitin superfamily)
MKTYNGSGLTILIDIIFALIVGAFAYVIFGFSLTVFALTTIFFFFIFLAMSIRVVNEWNRMPVLRLGKYNGIIGPGFITIIPIIETTPYSIDLRVKNSIFGAEQTLTKDNVPVNVDAILFWQVYDPEKTILNVQIYYDSIQVASQTALRDVIGKTLLSEMLAGRNMIGKDIKDIIDERIETWGIKVISVEIRDVKIPQELQDAMARVATSEREKNARVILAESESLAADKMLEAAHKYQTNIYAMQLRALNMMYEISLNGKNLMIFVPTDSKGFSMPTPIGIMGIEDLVKNKTNTGKKTDGKSSDSSSDNPTTKQKKQKVDSSTV